MATLIFENETEFENREVLEDNGVTQDCLDILYNGSLSEYEADNTNNIGCFNVVQCTDCKDCIECTSSSDLVDCDYCVDCTNCEELTDCSNCEDSSLLENCDNMTSCADCIDSNFCLDSEGLVEESFVVGESSEDEDEDDTSVNSPQQSSSYGNSTAGALDTFGDLSGVKP